MNIRTNFGMGPVMSRALLMIGVLALFCGAAQADSLSVTSAPTGTQPLGSTVSIVLTYVFNPTISISIPTDFTASVTMDITTGPDAGGGPSAFCTALILPSSPTGSCTLDFPLTNDGTAGIDTLYFSGSSTPVGSATLSGVTVTFGGSSPVPEPSTLLLLCPGLLALMGAIRRTRVA